MKLEKVNMRMVETDISKEIKKEYLLRHLDEVKEIIAEWIKELGSPQPFNYKKRHWGWQEVYKSEIELDIDKIHMLRRHILNRTLWQYHTEWEKQLTDTWEHIIQTRKRAIQLKKQDSYERTENNTEMSYTDNYLESAVWTAFNQIQERNIKHDLNYKTSNNEKGLYYGSYGIETTVDNPEGRKLVEQHHRGLIGKLQMDEVMIKAVEQITLIKETEKNMIELAEKHLKATDILHPCKFCRHLWK